MPTGTAIARADLLRIGSVQPRAPRMTMSTRRIQAHAEGDIVQAQIVQPGFMALCSVRVGDLLLDSVSRSNTATPCKPCAFCVIFCHRNIAEPPPAMQLTQRKGTTFHSELQGPIV
jgi:hypothetical protein